MEFRVVSVQYFMDEMRQYEIPVLTSIADVSVKHSWEQAREVAYMTALVNAKRGSRLKPTDIMQFPWDNDAKKNVKPITSKEVEAMKRNVLASKELLIKQGIING